MEKEKLAGKAGLAEEFFDINKKQFSQMLVRLENSVSETYRPQFVGTMNTAALLTKLRGAAASQGYSFEYKQVIANPKSDYSQEWSKVAQGVYLTLADNTLSAAESAQAIDDFTNQFIDLGERSGIVPVEKLEAVAA